MPDITTTVVGRAAGSLLTYGSKRLWSRIVRLQKVRDAFDANPSKALSHPAVSTALADIVHAIGHQGQYTETVAAFLNDLKSSGLIDPICLTAITGTSSKGTFSAFKLLYEQHSIGASLLGLSADAMYNKIQAMAKASILGNEEATNYFSKEALIAIRDLAVTEDAVLKSHFTVNKPSGEELSYAELIKERPWLQQAPATLDDLIKRLKQAILPHFDSIKVEGPAMKSLSIPSEQIYVESALLTQDTKTAAGIILRPVPVSDFLDDLTKAAVIGDPGGGKSTLVRVLCGNLCRDVSEPLPIFVTLRKYYAARKSDVTLSLLQHVLEELAEQSNIVSAAEISLPIRNLLSFGKAIVVFDGLDEIISVGQRREVAAAISQFCSTYNLCRYVVTSRKVDYQIVKVVGFSEYELGPFDNAAVRKYVSLSAQHVFHRKLAEIPAETERFMEAVKRDASDFISNPLLLSLIVWLFNSTQKIPDNRAEIYQECSTLLFQRWDALREISTDVPDAHRLFGLLAYLAKDMYLNPELQGGATRKWLGKAIKEYFLTDYTDNAEARAINASDKFLEHLAGRAWVLRALGSDQYEFTHRTFMEYFFARYLNDENLSLDNLIDELSPRIRAAEWNVPAHLAIQIAVGGKRKHSEHAVDRLIKLYQEANKSEKPLIAEFVGDATEYLQPSEAGLEEISKIITLEVKDDDVWKRAFVSVLQTPNEMRGAIFRGLGKGFAELVKNSQLHRIAFVLDWLKACNVSQFKCFPNSASPRLSGFIESREVFVKEILTEIEKIEDVSAAAFKASFDLGNKIDYATATTFGLRLWLSSSELPLRRLDWRAIDFQLMLFEFSELMSGKLAITGAPYAQLAMALAKSDLSQAPYAITQGQTVTGALSEMTIQSLCGLTNLSEEWAEGIAFATLGLNEISTGAVIKKYHENKILTQCINSLPKDSQWAKIIEKWRMGNHNLFQQLPAQHPTIPLSRILQ